MLNRSRLLRTARSVGVYGLIVVVTLLFLDLVMVATGLFEPPPPNYGDPAIGWISVDPTGKMETFPCVDPATGAVVPIDRNERGYRSSVPEDQLARDTPAFEIAVTGDSHTDLCLTNDQMHFGVMEQVLDSLGLTSIAFAHGAGRYSPLQEYLAIRQGLIDFRPDALVMNLYTGNDFYDILRVDDRPHLIRGEDGYEIAPPIWYQYDAPGTKRRSRVLYAVESIVEGVGVANLWTRLRYLTAAAADQGSTLTQVFSYVSDLRKATTADVGYPAAFAAQILNQQLFFHHFPGSSEESLRRIGALLSMIKTAHPDVLLIMSPIPSYQLVQEQPVDPAFLEVLSQLPVTYEDGVAMEERLYQRLGEEARSRGWLFVDNLDALRSYDGNARLYNDFDYHVTLEANQVIGRNQARSIADWTR